MKVRREAQSFKIITLITPSDHSLSDVQKSKNYILKETSKDKSSHPKEIAIRHNSIRR